ncbi:hypothetical protein TRFO_28147 [Tritrichomonas foetus]|uniref:Peptidase S8/S53 domain-containing protein n=1 Tax=Tritrichomonas foetus TaxID=1144522 RepID=A0A1J4JZC7_9EUKA|nr:hypothetical protein TRFO_28147 [Tritrichomonas foetus]|eukprot:OHT04331.1 hypothetical protein TRFO_28147 [Tritrichomonas foetus]
MIIFPFLIVQSLGAKKFSYFGRTVSLKSKKSILSETNNWYFVNFNSQHEVNVNNIKEVKINPSNFIESNLYRLYLTPQIAQLLHTQNNVTIQPISIDNKIVDDLDYNKNRFYAEFHESFNPENYQNNNQNSNDQNNFVEENIKNSETKFLNLFKTIYEVTTNDVLSILNIPELLYIGNAPENHLHNRWGVGFIQQNGPPRTTNKYGFHNYQYLQEHGLTGKGQTVTICDSGLDVNNSFFYDPDHSFTFDTLNPNHRKILYYYSYGNRIDAPNGGHGTHVSGTAAGNSMCGNEMSLYNGAASDAKIHFIDISQKDESKSLLSCPITIISTGMGLTNSYVSSNSWGSSSRSYGQTKLYDMASKYLSDRLFVFSAGNNGEKGHTTINSPGDGKNILTIGALASTYGHLFEDSRKRSLILINNENNKNYQLSEALNANLFAATTGVYQQRASTTPEKGKVFITSNSRDVCSIAEENSPTAAIVATSSSPSCSNPLSFPVYKAIGNKDDILRLTNVTISLSVSEDYFVPGINYYSSKGPSYFGIIKPDVVAPGEDIKSASSHPTGTVPGSDCSIDKMIEKTGTSMACPNVAGLATLVYQYFMDGYYPSGNKNPTDSFIPGSCLVRALIIASAVKTGDSWTPNSVFGHGIVNIENILPFSDNQNVNERSHKESYKHSNKDLQEQTNSKYINEDEEMKKKLILKVFKDVKITANEEKVMKFSVLSKERDLRLAMAYLDEPDSSDTKILYIDLNMFLVLPNGKIIYGNQRPKNHEEHFSTVEKIVIEKEELEIGEYEIHIIGNDRINSVYKQRTLFSLCVAGSIDFNSFSEWQQVSKTPKVCQFPQIGINCQITAEEVKSEGVTVYENMENYYYIKMPEDYSNVTILIQRPLDITVRQIFQFSSESIPFDSSKYEITHSTSEPLYQVYLKRSQFKVVNHTFLGLRITNLGPNRFTSTFKFVYDEYVPPLPTRTTPASTWKTEYIVSIYTGYGLLIVTVILLPFFIWLYINTRNVIARYVERKHIEMP